MRLWRKFLRLLESSVNQRVTRVGLLFTLLTILVALAAFSSGNNLLFLILAAMLATLMISGLVSRLSLAGLALDLALPDHISARRTFPARIIVHNEKRWMPSFSIALRGHGDTPLAHPLYFPVIPGGGRAQQPVDVFFPKRGAYGENAFRFSTRFPFGFAEKRVHVLLRREVLVYPSIDPRPGFEDLLATLQGEIESRFRGQGSDFYRIRPYETSESARHVDWRATAHTGQLQVREFAREEEQTVTFLLDLDFDEPHRDWFEDAVDCCAFLVWNLSLRNTNLRFQTQTTDLALPLAADAYSILRYLATVGPVHGRPLPPQSDPGAYQIVFTQHPDRARDLGWGVPSRDARLFSPLNAAPVGSAEPAAHFGRRQGPWV